MKFDSDTEMFDVMKEKLYTAILSDALDILGLRNQAMRADIRPLFPEAIVVGRAMTVQAIDVYKMSEEPFKMEIETLDSLKPNNVLVLSNNHSTRASSWGELCSTAASARGARGAVIDGYARDVKGIIQMQFPVFVTGIMPVDTSGRIEVVDYNCPIECGDVLVNPDDLVFGDIDGIVVIPGQKVESEVLKIAFDKMSKEDKTREELRRGTLLKDVFKKYKTL